MSKQFAAILAVIVLAFAGIIFISSNKDSSSSSKSTAGTLTNHVEGSTASGVKLVEYGDFQCPFCEQYSSTVAAVVEEYKDRIQFQFRNYPLVNAHPNAFAAARAAEAAALQDKYWEMHDILYQPSNWQTWTTASDPTPYFKQYATALGLNASQFATDFASSKVNDIVRADMAEGNRIKIQGTPTFFLVTKVNGKEQSKQVTIQNDKASFEKVLNAEIAKQAPKTTTSTTNSTTTSTSPAESTEATTPDTQQ